MVEGVEAKTVLIRAVGPTLAEFGVGGALRARRALAVMQGAVSVATNTGWGTASDPAALTAAAARAGAFALAEGNADWRLLLNLVPGAYSAVVSATRTGDPGVGLVEVYKSSRRGRGPAAEQSLHPGGGWFRGRRTHQWESWWTAPHPNDCWCGRSVRRWSSSG